MSKSFEEWYDKEVDTGLVTGLNIWNAALLHAAEIAEKWECNHNNGCCSCGCQDTVGIIAEKLRKEAECK